jgi:hypothetical protein
MSVNRTDFDTVEDTFGEDVDIDARPTQATSTSTAVKSGWDAADELSTSEKDYPVEFKHSEDIQVIKFVDQNGPFASYKQHFLQQKTVGKRSYICIGANCPLCTVLENRPEDKRAFTIVNLSAGNQRQMLISTPRFFKTLKAAEFSPQGPLPKNYWAVSRSGVKQTTVYNLNVIKSRDLLEDWGIDEATAETAVAATAVYERSAIRENSYAELLEIANELV